MAEPVKFQKRYEPKIPKCFFCGRDKDELVFTQLNHNRPFRDYKPCTSCRLKLASGLTLIAVTNRHPADGRPAIAKASNGQDLYPTGKWCVIREEHAETIFDPAGAERIKKSRVGYVPEPLVDQLVQNMMRNTQK